MMQRLMGGMVALVLSVSAVAAQQPVSPNRHSEGKGQMPMMMMDSLNLRLDSLVDRMNRTSGDKKVQAMAAVINELVTQRKMMQERMHQMMDSGGMMGAMGKPMSGDPKSPAKNDSAPPDSTDHSAHHPPE